MHVILPDGSQKELPDGASGADLAAAIGPGLARAALAVKVGGEVRDLARPLSDGDEVAIVTNRDDDSLDLIRHDTAHVLAAAVLDLYPGTKISIGPPIEDGFYYDFEFPEGVTVSDADFEQLEAKMREHVKAGEEFVREDVSPQAALERFKTEGQDYKVELIDDLVSNNGVDSVSLYTNGPFTDLCRGPHAPSTDRIKAFKLLSVAGAYWRGDSDNTMLTRIYGTAFHSKDDLAAHLERLEQARQRDHRKLGRELGLFGFSELSPGSVFWTPHGTAVYNALVARSRQMSIERGYDGDQDAAALRPQAVGDLRPLGQVPREHVRRRQSEDRPMALKPMNCPGHCAFYAMGSTPTASSRCATPSPATCTATSRAARCTACCASATSSRTTRTSSAPRSRSRTRCSRCLEFGFAWYDMFGFDMNDRALDPAGAADRHRRDVGPLGGCARGGAEARRHEYEINEGDGAFYGPKIDLHMRDSLNRSWQLGTVQLDYNFPERFEPHLHGRGQRRAPAGDDPPRAGRLVRALHRDPARAHRRRPAAVAGAAPGRGAAGGRPPPDYAREVGRGAAPRPACAPRSTSAPSRSGARSARPSCARCPYMLVVGDREAERAPVALRRHREGDLGTSRRRWRIAERGATLVRPKSRRRIPRACETASALTPRYAFPDSAPRSV